MNTSSSQTSKPRSNTVLIVLGYIASVLILLQGFSLSNLVQGDNDIRSQILPPLALIAGGASIFLILLRRYKWLWLTGLIAMAPPVTIALSFLSKALRRGEYEYIIGPAMMCIPALFLWLVAYLNRGSNETASVAFDPSSATKKCPNCAEEIKLEALVCRFCKHTFSQAEVESQIEQARVGSIEVNAEASRLKAFEKRWR